MNNIGHLLKNLSPGEKSLIRKIEKINYKINSAEVAKIIIIIINTLTGQNDHS